MRITSRLFKGTADDVVNASRMVWCPPLLENSVIVEDLSEMARRRKNLRHAFFDMQTYLANTMHGELHCGSLQTATSARHGFFRRKNFCGSLAGNVTDWVPPLVVTASPTEVQPLDEKFVFDSTFNNRVDLREWHICNDPHLFFIA